MLLSAAAAQLLLSVSVIQADDLQSILASRSYRMYVQQDQRAMRWMTSAKYFDLDSSFARLFIEPEGSGYIEKWFSPSSSLTDITLTGTKYGKTLEYIGTERDFVHRVQKEMRYNLITVVPHPRYIESARYKLLDVYYKLYPPSITFTKSETIKIQEKEATLYQVSEGMCQINIILPKETLVVFTGPCGTPDTKKQFFEWMESFTFNLFEDKLTH